MAAPQLEVASGRQRFWKDLGKTQLTVRNDRVASGMLAAMAEATAETDQRTLAPGRRLSSEVNDRA